MQPHLSLAGKQHFSGKLFGVRKPQMWAIHTHWPLVSYYEQIDHYVQMAGFTDWFKLIRLSPRAKDGVNLIKMEWLCNWK